MPKDPAKNVDRYKIGGGQLNEFEFQQNQGAIREEERQRFARQEEEREVREGETVPTPQTEAERIAQLMADVKEKVQRKKEKEMRPADGGALSTLKRSSSKKSGTKKAGAAKKAVSAKKAAPEKAGATKKASATKRAGKFAAQRASTGGAKKPSTKKTSAVKRSASKKTGAKSVGKRASTKSTAKRSMKGATRRTTK